MIELGSCATGPTATWENPSAEVIGMVMRAEQWLVLKTDPGLGEKFTSLSPSSDEILYKDKLK